MCDQFGADGEIRELKLGDTFSKNFKGGAFYTIQYDFKPASVDTQKMGNVEFGEKNEVTVTVPHVEGAGTSQTVFKGMKKPAAKECILIYDHNTDTYVLERISQKIIVKKTRPDNSKVYHQNHHSSSHETLADKKRPSPSQNYSPLNPPGRVTNGMPTIKPSHKVSPSTKCSPHSSISGKSPNSLPTPGSMPVLGLEDDSKMTGVMSDSSSDSESNSGSSSSSDSDSESETEQRLTNDSFKDKGQNGVSNGANIGRPSEDQSVFDDLELSSEDDSS